MTTLHARMNRSGKNRLDFLRRVAYTTATYL